MSIENSLKMQHAELSTVLQLSKIRHEACRFQLVSFNVEQLAQQKCHQGRKATDGTQEA